MGNPDMTTKLVTQKLKQGIFSLSTSNTGSKSDVWKCFSVVKDENQQEITYVSCKQCFTSFIYNGRKTGKYLALNVHDISNVQVNYVKNINLWGNLEL